jgi:hypothetical protein
VSFLFRVAAAVINVASIIIVAKFVAAAFDTVASLIKIGVDEYRRRATT